MTKKQQAKLLTEIMQADAKDGLYSDISILETTQTAVEWLAIELYEKMNMSGDGKIFDSLIRVAKQMEKKQIIKAFNDLNDDISAEQYYNETYNKNK